MPEFPEQDRPYERVSQQRKQKWFNALMSRALTKGTYVNFDDLADEDLTPQELAARHDPDQANPFGWYDLYTYTFDADELQRANFDPSVTMIELNFGSTSHPDHGGIIPYVAIAFYQSVVYTEDRVIMTKQEIELDKESPDHIAEFVSSPQPIGNTELASAESIRNIGDVAELYRQTGLREIDPLQAQQLDRLSELT